MLLQVLFLTLLRPSKALLISCCCCCCCCCGCYGDGRVCFNRRLRQQPSRSLRLIDNIDTDCLAHMNTPFQATDTK